MVVDQVTDVSATFDEVCNNESVRESFLVVGRTFPWQESSVPVIYVMVYRGLKYLDFKVAHIGLIRNSCLCSHPNSFQ